MNTGCVFNTLYGSECTGEQLSTNRDISRILSIVSASEKRNDTLHQKLTPLLAEDENLKINYHKNCVGRYCLATAYDKFTPPPKKQRRSTESPFDLKEHCLFCRFDCKLQCDPKQCY